MCNTDLDLAVSRQPLDLNPVYTDPDSDLDLKKTLAVSRKVFTISIFSGPRHIPVNNIQCDIRQC